MRHPRLRHGHLFHHHRPRQDHHHLVRQIHYHPSSHPTSRPLHSPYRLQLHLAAVLVRLHPALAAACHPRYNRPAHSSFPLRHSPSPSPSRPRPRPNFPARATVLLRWCHPHSHPLHLVRLPSHSAPELRAQLPRLSLPSAVPLLPVPAKQVATRTPPPARASRHSVLR